MEETQELEEEREAPNAVRPGYGGYYHTVRRHPMTFYDAYTEKRRRYPIGEREDNWWASFSASETTGGKRREPQPRARDEQEGAERSMVQCPIGASEAFSALLRFSITVQRMDPNNQRLCLHDRFSQELDEMIWNVSSLMLDVRPYSPTDELCDLWEAQRTERGSDDVIKVESFTGEGDDVGEVRASEARGKSASSSSMRQDASSSSGSPSTAAEAKRARDPSDGSIKEVDMACWANLKAWQLQWFRDLLYESGIFQRLRPLMVHSGPRPSTSKDGREEELGPPVITLRSVRQAGYAVASALQLLEEVREAGHSIADPDCLHLLAEVGLAFLNLRFMYEEACEQWKREEEQEEDIVDPALMTIRQELKRGEEDEGLLAVWLRLVCLPQDDIKRLEVIPQRRRSSGNSSFKLLWSLQRSFKAFICRHFMHEGRREACLVLIGRIYKAIWSGLKGEGDEFFRNNALVAFNSDFFGNYEDSSIEQPLVHLIARQSPCVDITIALLWREREVEASELVRGFARLLIGSVANGGERLVTYEKLVGKCITFLGHLVTDAKATNGRRQAVASTSAIQSAFQEVLARYSCWAIDIPDEGERPEKTAFLLYNLASVLFEDKSYALQRPRASAAPDNGQRTSPCAETAVFEKERIEKVWCNSLVYYLYNSHEGSGLQDCPALPLLQERLLKMLRLSNDLGFAALMVLHILDEPSHCHRVYTSELRLSLWKVLQGASQQEECIRELLAIAKEQRQRKVGIASGGKTTAEENLFYPEHSESDDEETPLSPSRSSFSLQEGALQEPDESTIDTLDPWHKSQEFKPLLSFLSRDALLGLEGEPYAPQHSELCIAVGRVHFQSAFTYIPSIDDPITKLVLQTAQLQRQLEDERELREPLDWPLLEVVDYLVRSQKPGAMACLLEQSQPALSTLYSDVRDFWAATLETEEEKQMTDLRHLRNLLTITRSPSFSATEARQSNLMAITREILVEIMGLIPDGELIEFERQELLLVGCIVFRLCALGVTLPSVIVDLDVLTHILSYEKGWEALVDCLDAENSNIGLEELSSLEQHLESSFKRPPPSWDMDLAVPQPEIYDWFAEEALRCCKRRIQKASSSALDSALSSIDSETSRRVMKSELLTELARSDTDSQSKSVRGHSARRREVGDYPERRAKRSKVTQSQLEHAIGQEQTETTARSSAVAAMAYVEAVGLHRADPQSVWNSLCGLEAARENKSRPSGKASDNQSLVEARERVALQMKRPYLSNQPIIAYDRSQWINYKVYKDKMGAVNGWRQSKEEKAPVVAQDEKEDNAQGNGMKVKASLLQDIRKDEWLLISRSNVPFSSNVLSLTSFFPMDSTCHYASSLSVHFAKNYQRSSNSRFEIYYFECTILSVPTDGTPWMLSIGLTEADHPEEKYIGEASSACRRESLRWKEWHRSDRSTVGYLSKGKIEVSTSPDTSGTAPPELPAEAAYSEGDTVGAGYHTSLRTFFFTKNGQLVYPRPAPASRDSTCEDAAAADSQAEQTKASEETDHSDSQTVNSSEFWPWGVKHRIASSSLSYIYPGVSIQGPVDLVVGVPETQSKDASPTWVRDLRHLTQRLEDEDARQMKVIPKKGNKEKESNKEKKNAKGEGKDEEEKGKDPVKKDLVFASHISTWHSLLDSSRFRTLYGKLPARCTKEKWVVPNRSRIFYCEEAVPTDLLDDLERDVNDVAKSYSPGLRRQLFHLKHDMQEKEGLRKRGAVEVIDPSHFPYVRGLSAVQDPVAEQQLWRTGRPRRAKRSDSPYQLLPSIFWVSEEGEVQIRSDVCGAPRELFPELYQTLSRLFSLFVPLFERCCEAKLRNQELQVMVRCTEYRYTREEGGWDTAQEDWRSEGSPLEDILAVGMCCYGINEASGLAGKLCFRQVEGFESYVEVPKSLTAARKADFADVIFPYYGATEDREPTVGSVIPSAPVILREGGIAVFKNNVQYSLQPQRLEREGATHSSIERRLGTLTFLLVCPRHRIISTREVRSEPRELLTFQLLSVLDEVTARKNSRLFRWPVELLMKILSFLPEEGLTLSAVIAHGQRFYHERRLQNAEKSFYGDMTVSQWRGIQRRIIQSRRSFKTNADLLAEQKAREQEQQSWGRTDDY